jgi:hypothetical protein
MSFSICIQPCQTIGTYGINSLCGYQINSITPINLEETKKIKDILGSFVELTIATENMKPREEKFQRYVAWRPREEWGTNPEYRYYKTATERLNKAQYDFSDIKTQYQVTSIIPFSNS